MAIKALTKARAPVSLHVEPPASGDCTAPLKRTGTRIRAHGAQAGNGRQITRESQISMPRAGLTV